MSFRDDDINLRKAFARPRAAIPKDFSSQAVRDELRRSVDPQWIAAKLIEIVNDARSTAKDKLMALKLITDRRDGMPTAMVITAHASMHHALGDITPAALDQLDQLLAGQMHHAQLTAGSLDGDEDYCEPESYIDIDAID